ncbi:hypothetical protein CVS30_08640 [Arthrobacter psychrolactophilus]|uniref:Uncharacterized protein n=1 Tax=Arthrobacter psychrolactophilus TaxID=92442 RepID=A0A2V5IQP5_9MICC|nr:hypothetical protein CVS30_08640 [Arthrobacter psychrolactophilus]
MSQRSTFILLVVLGLLLLAVACLAAVLTGYFAWFLAIAGTALAIVGALGVRRIDRGRADGD